MGIPGGSWEHGRKALLWDLGHEEEAVIARDIKCRRKKYLGFSIYPAIQFPANEPRGESEASWQGRLGNIDCTANKQRKTEK